MKISAVKITVTRAEGYQHETGKTYEFTGPNVWDDANHRLRIMSLTAPGAPGESDLGYHKTDFTIHYADGTTYSGCLDLTYTQHSLHRHIRESLQHAVANAEAYTMAGYDVADAQMTLETYEIGASS